MTKRPEPFAVELPLPISTNELYTVTRGKNRIVRPISEAYEVWKRAANEMLSKQRLRRIAWQADVLITVGGKCRVDPDNCCKAVIDMLVHVGVLRNDNWTCIRKLSVIRSKNVTNTIVTIWPCDES